MCRLSPISADRRSWNEARKLKPDGDLVFPTVTGRMIQAPVLSALLRENKIEAVPHGFRSSSFRQWAAECKPTSRAKFASMR